MPVAECITLNPSRLTPLTVVGRGGFGTVFMAFNADAAAQRRKSEEVVAVKVMPERNHRSERKAIHLMIEQQVLHQTRGHPHIIKLLASYATLESYVFVTEAGRCSLADLAGRRISESYTRFAISEVCQGVEHLHSLNIIHRDLKPANIVIGMDGHMRVIDFGLAVQVPSKYLATSGVTMGTPGYMAPEVRRGSWHSYPVDWWGVGTIMYELLTGLVGAVSPRNPAEPYEIATDRWYGENVSPEAKSLSVGLLNVNPHWRTGTSGDIRRQEFFKSVRWNKLNGPALQTPPRIPGKNNSQLKL